jgi:hypothetical protein
MDELPQLLNVLKGEMSLIGPRPHATHMKVGDRFYQDAVRGYAGRHRVRPGITGLAQVKGVRGEIRTVERAKLRVDWDMKYIENWSLWLDVKILAQDVRINTIGVARATQIRDAELTTGADITVFCSIHLSASPRPGGFLSRTRRSHEIDENLRSPIVPPGYVCLVEASTC